MDEVALHIKQDRGARAEALLRDDLLQEAFKLLHAEYASEWVRTAPNDTAGRERLWQAVRIIGQVEHHLRRVAQDGRIASKDLSNIKYLKRA